MTLEVQREFAAMPRTDPLAVVARRTALDGRLQAMFSLREAIPRPGALGSGDPPTVAVASWSGPLELRRPIGSENRWFMRNVTAGVFGGDSYDVALTCGLGASAWVEATSATKVYAMPDAAASSRVRLRAENGGRLVWGPHTTILLGGSAYSSATEVALAGGIVIAAETLVMGRLAAGEAFSFHRYEASICVHDEAGRDLFVERAVLQPSKSLRYAMAGKGALTTVYALGRSIDKEIGQRLTDLTLAYPFAGWSELPNGAGLIVKALVASASEGDAFARRCIGLLT